MKKGYLTVFLSLTLTLILSLLLTLIEGARMSTIKMEAECVADIGMNSILAEYHRELLEQYDLFFVDTSYGMPSSSIHNTAEHLRNYTQKNFTVSEKGWISARDWLALSTDKVSIPELSIASDDGGNVMKRQALDYMKSSTVEGKLIGLTNQVSEHIGLLEGLGLDTRDIGAERGSIQGQIDAIELPKQENEEGEMIEISLDNPADKVNSTRGIGVLNLILKDTTNISQSAIYAEHYISHRSRNRGTGMNPDLPAPSGIMDNILFNEYLLDKCGYYGNELDKSLLKYQIEYIIAGKESDWDNLEKVAKRILTWREVANVIYILSDSGKCAEARALALTLTAVLQVPALTEPVKYAILFAWAYIESLSDVRRLLTGGRVPIVKTAGDWRTGIQSVKNFNGTIPDSGNEGNGLNYKDYLKIMLLLQEDTIKNMRAMDIMEMDIRQTPGNKHFRMDVCFDSFLATISVSSKYGYHYDITKRYAYY